jgi:glycosyltransferase involved in cell wall biosynthesis
MASIMATDRIWLSWETQRRTVELSRKFNAQLHILETSKKGVPRYLVLTQRTIRTLLTCKPEIVFVQNPSVILATLVLLLRPLFGYRVVVDRHTNFKFGTRHSRQLKWRVFHALSQFTLRAADITIVTNRYLRLYIKQQGANAYILPDPLPALRPGDHHSAGETGKLSGFFVCTFAEDEPYREVFEAMKQHPDTDFYVTGNFKKANPNTLDAVGNNIHLLGFVPEQDYIDHLFRCDFSIILTTQEFTLNCGAYESLVANKPAVLANTLTIRRYFSKGFVYTDPCSVDAINHAIGEVGRRLDELKADQVTLRKELTQEWSILKDRIDQQIQVLTPTGATDPTSNQQ